MTWTQLPFTKQHIERGEYTSYVRLTATSGGIRLLIDEGPLLGISIDRHPMRDEPPYGISLTTDQAIELATKLIELTNGEPKGFFKDSRPTQEARNDN